MSMIDVALKDLKRVFRSAFALMMMFGAPLLLAGLLYFAFGGLTEGDRSFALTRTRVIIANLDQAGSTESPFKAGTMLVEFLQNKDLSDVLEVSMTTDEASARSAVDRRQEEVALIIPANFTRAALAPEQKAAVLLYQDPTLTIGPGIVKDLVDHFMDGFSGAKIAAKVTNSTLQQNGAAPDPSSAEWAAQQYAAYLESSSHTTALQIASPVGETEQPAAGLAMMGPIMAGMLVFFVFFMGANGAQSIIHEHEEGTLARLFTTPTPATLILGGKFVGVFLTLILQTITLLVASTLLFQISWGKPLAVGLAMLGLVVAATGFGLMLMSFIRSTRQTGPVLGGVMTLTGMLGGLFTSSMPNLPEVMDKVALSMPQGWALQAWKLSLEGNPAGAVLPSAIVLMVLGVLFFAIGLTMFRRRFI